MIDTMKYEAIKNDVTLDLTNREYELLKFFVTQPNRIFSREALLSSVWGYEFFGDVRTVDVTVRRLREKIEDELVHDFKEVISSYSPTPENYSARHMLEQAMG